MKWIAQICLHLASIMVDRPLTKLQPQKHPEKETSKFVLQYVNCKIRLRKYIPELKMCNQF